MKRPKLRKPKSEDGFKPRMNSYEDDLKKCFKNNIKHKYAFSLKMTLKVRMTLKGRRFK